MTSKQNKQHHNDIIACLIIAVALSKVNTGDPRSTDDNKSIELCFCFSAPHTTHIRQTLKYDISTSLLMRMQMRLIFGALIILQPAKKDDDTMLGLRQQILSKQHS